MSKLEHPFGDIPLTCQSCGVEVHESEALGYGHDYLCPDCFGQQSVDQKFIHEWLLYPDYMFHDGRVATIAIHKSVAGRRSDQADCSTHEPEDGVTRFGPGSLASSLSSIEDMHFDVIDVYCLFDEGYLNSNAHLIFKGESS